jgi:predicted nucleic acid-binding Zn ribbon protein
MELRLPRLQIPLHLLQTHTRGPEANFAGTKMAVLDHPRGGAFLTCPECGCLNTRKFVYVGSGAVQYECANCGCIFQIKTQIQIDIVKHGREAGI